MSKPTTPERGLASFLSREERAQLAGELQAMAAELRAAAELALAHIREELARRGMSEAEIEALIAKHRSRRRRRPPSALADLVRRLEAREGR